MEFVDHATQQNAALVEQSAVAAERLIAQVQQLVQAVSAFKLRDDAAVGDATALQPERLSRAGAEPACVERRSLNRARNVLRPKFAADAPAARVRTGT